MGPRAVTPELRCFMNWLLAVAVVGLESVPRSAEAQFGPQTLVREFCRLDAVGARATVQGWSQISPLVQWEFEPAWDRVVLITSYTVGWPVAHEENSFVVEVRYAVRGTVTAAGFDENSHIEARTFRVDPSPDGNWKIAGPPPPPHIFANDVDIAAMQQSLQRGGVNFLPNSLFVWQLYRRNGWDIPFEHTAALAQTQVFRTTTKPEPGDLVLYLDGQSPYHVGVLESEDVVVSTTLNGGMVRTPLEAFGGERRFLHLRPPELWPPTPTPRLSREEIERILPSVLPQATPTVQASAVPRTPSPRNKQVPRGKARSQQRKYRRSS